MKKIVLFLVTLFPLYCLSQTIETKNFQWDSNPALHELTADESAQTAVILNDDRQIEYIYNKNDELEEYYFHHRIVHISDTKAVDDFNKVYVAVGSPSDLIVFKARSIDKNGKVKEMLLGEMKEVDDKGQRYMSLAVDGLEKNTELEYYFTTKLNTSSFQAENVHSDFRIRKCELKVISPENIVIEGKAYNGLAQFKDTIIGRKRILTTSVTNVIPVPEEHYATTEANQMRVEIKICKNLKKGDGRLLTWADAGNRYYDRCCRFEKDEIKEADKVADKLQLKKKPEAESIRAIENYVKTAFEITESSDVTNIGEIIKKKYADQLGICRLTSALLKSAGVKFELLITISRYKKKFDPDFDTWNNLDDILFYFPSQNAFLSPVNFAYRTGLLPERYIGQSGLFIKEVAIGDIASAVSSVKKIPVPLSVSNVDSLNVDINFSPDFSSVQQKTVHSFSGYSSTVTRPYYFYDTEEKKKEMLINLLKNGIEDAVVTNEKAVNYNLSSDEADKPFIISGDAKYSSVIEKAGTTFLFNVGAVIGPQEQLYTDKQRQQPIDIEYLHSYNRIITIKIPDGYSAKELKALNMNITSDDGPQPTMGFVSSYSLKNNTLEIYITEYYNKISYPANYFDVFRKVINASADFNKIKIAFEKS